MNCFRVARPITRKAAEMLGWEQEGAWGQAFQQHHISYRLQLIMTLHSQTTVRKGDELHLPLYWLQREFWFMHLTHRWLRLVEEIASRLHENKDTMRQPVFSACFTKGSSPFHRDGPNQCSNEHFVDLLNRFGVFFSSNVQCFAQQQHSGRMCSGIQPFRSTGNSQSSV